MGSHFLLQEIFLTQELPASHIAGRFFYHLSHKGNAQSYINTYKIESEVIYCYRNGLQFLYRDVCNQVSIAIVSACVSDLA